MLVGVHLGNVGLTRAARPFLPLVDKLLVHGANLGHNTVYEIWTHWPDPKAEPASNGESD